MFLLPRRATVGGMLFHAGALVNINVPAYTRADARFELPLSGLLSLSITGQNLLHATHVEYGGVGAIVTPTLIPRSAAVNLVWAARR